VLVDVRDILKTIKILVTHPTDKQKVVEYSLWNFYSGGLGSGDINHCIYPFDLKEIPKIVVDSDTQEKLISLKK
jgi:hypothetical protein